jgi:hypothetical protein
MSNKLHVQGEGDYEAARRFNKNEQDFVKHKYGNRRAANRQDLYVPQNDDQDEDTVELQNPRIKFPDRR